MKTRYFVEFASADDAVSGAKELRRRGYTRMEAFTPYAVPELDEALAVPRTKIPIVVFCAGLTGCVVAYLILWWTASVDYPVMVGGRPFNSLPAHIPIMFETTVLFAGIASFFSVLLLSRLPAIWHPVFEVDGFERTTLDRYWIGIDDRDPKFDAGIGAELKELGAVGVRRADEETP